MNRRAATLALALAAACDCGGDHPVVWAGLRDAPRIAAFDGTAERIAAAPPAIDAPVRALVVLGSGEVLALQEPEVCAGGTLDPVADACAPSSAARVAVPPAVRLSRAGERRGVLDGAAAGGSALFTIAAPPWAAAEDPAGRIWVTGGTAPVVYGPDGHVAFLAEASAFPSRGVAALADGRVVVSYGVQDLAVYGADGAVTARISPALGDAYEGLDAVAAEGDGTLLLATRRFGVTSSGVVLRARLEGASLVLAQDAALSADLPGGVPSALAQADGRILAAPPLGRLASPQCGRWVSADLAADLGCAVPGPHRGAAWLAP